VAHVTAKGVQFFTREYSLKAKAAKTLFNALPESLGQA
jgi:hypothetical protein